MCVFLGDFGAFRPLVITYLIDEKGFSIHCVEMSSLASSIAVWVYTEAPSPEACFSMWDTTYLL